MRATAVILVSTLAALITSLLSVSIMTGARDYSKSPTQSLVLDILLIMISALLIFGAIIGLRKKYVEP